MLESLHKKWSFSLRILSVKVTKFAVCCVFSHIYWSNPKWKTSFFVQWILLFYLHKICNRFKIVTSFSFLTLHAVNISLLKKILSLTLLKIITVSRPTTLIRVFLMRRSSCSTKGGNWGGGRSSCKQKSLNFSLLLDITPTKKLGSPVPLLITDHILGKKYL